MRSIYGRFLASLGPPVSILGEVLADPCQIRTAPSIRPREPVKTVPEPDFQMPELCQIIGHLAISDKNYRNPQTAPLGSKVNYRNHQEYSVISRSVLSSFHCWRVPFWQDLLAGPRKCPEMTLFDLFYASFDPWMTPGMVPGRWFEASGRGPGRVLGSPGMVREPWDLSGASLLDPWSCPWIYPIT